MTHFPSTFQNIQIGILRPKPFEYNAKIQRLEKCQKTHHPLSSYLFTLPDLFCVMFLNCVVCSKC